MIKEKLSDFLAEAFTRQSAIKAMGKSDDAILTTKSGDEYIIVNIDNGNDDNTATWKKDGVEGMPEEGGQGDERLIKWADIKSIEESVNEAKFKQGDIVAIGAPHFTKEILNKTGQDLEYNDTWKVEKQSGSKITLKGGGGSFSVDSKYFIMDESVIAEGGISDALIGAIEDYLAGKNKAKSIETLTNLTEKNKKEIEKILKDHNDLEDIMDAIMESLVEARTSIKRKYGVHASKNVNEKAPLRNAIIKNIGKKIMTESQIKNMLVRVEEDRGKPVNQTRWFKSNTRFFKISQNESGDKQYQLSKFGMRIFDHICKTKTTTNMKLVAESLEEFISEGREKLITKKTWDKLSDQEKEDKLMSAYKDPDEAMSHIDDTWDQLPSVATSNMFESTLNEASAQVTQAIGFIKSGAGWASDGYLEQFGGPLGLKPGELKELAIELAKQGLLYDEDKLSDDAMMNGELSEDDEDNAVMSVADAKKMKF